MIALLAEIGGAPITGVAVAVAVAGSIACPLWLRRRDGRR